MRAFAHAGMVLVDVYKYNSTVDSTPRTIGTIPLGYRPANPIQSTGLCRGDLNMLAGINVQSNGSIQVFTNTGSTTFARGSLMYFY